MPDAKTYDLAAAINEAREEHPPITIKLPTGKPIEIQPVELWPDDVIELVMAEQPVPAMRQLLGSDYERYTKAGGTAVLLLKIFQDAGGASLGKLLAS